MSEDQAQDWHRLLVELTTAMAQSTQATERASEILLELARQREREQDLREREAAAAHARAQIDLAVAEAAARRRVELEAESATWRAKLWATSREGFSSGPVQTVIAALTAAAIAAIGWWASRWNQPPGGSP